MRKSRDFVSVIWKMDEGVERPRPRRDGWYDQHHRVRPAMKHIPIQPPNRADQREQRRGANQRRLPDRRSRRSGRPGDRGALLRPRRSAAPPGLGRADRGHRRCRPSARRKPDHRRARRRGGTVRTADGRRACPRSPPWPPTGRCCGRRSPMRDWVSCCSARTRCGPPSASTQATAIAPWRSSSPPARAVRRGRGDDDVDGVGAGEPRGGSAGGVGGPGPARSRARPDDGRDRRQLAAARRQVHRLAQLAAVGVEPARLGPVRSDPRCRTARTRPATGRATR